ncbi:DUF3392 domain-containing protein [Aliidiomarina shirensis]|uniref:DUF3392 domain-containing protein n=1 Tax=Aliidiomarina shirensis TaxID=1048642 RepID=A0A432WXM4_9GAMM|nr:DUF3392 domain-containing protein [Aliidiomarina shirensis]RUO38509.1 DUF3392 domain-containing protein [Aliidiomarina shirensis]
MINEILLELGAWMRGHLTYISVMIAATLLVIFGNDVNRAVKRQIRHYHFFFRTIVFVLLCAFGYGILMNWMSPFIQFQLGLVSTRFLGPLVIGIMLALGIIAERKHTF